MFDLSVLVPQELTLEIIVVPIAVVTLKPRRSLPGFMTLRSSISDPLRIDSVKAGQLAGRVGMTFCPGKNQATSITGGWKRDLALDLHAINIWRAQVLISLMEAHEFLLVGVPQDELSRQTRALGIEWIDAPIIDGSVPSQMFLDRWRSIVPGLREILKEGGGVVFHCLGGLGRTGTMAACLLIEAGLCPDAAMAAVRTARPGTIENTTQERFVINYWPSTV